MRKILVLSLIAIILGIGAAGWFWMNRAGTLPTAAGRKGDLVEAVYGLGTVMAQSRYEVKLGITMRISKLPVNEGDKVEKGALLVVLNDSVVFKAPFAGVITEVPFQEQETVYPQTPILTLLNLEHPYISVALEQDGALRVRPGQLVKVSFESVHDQTYAGTVQTIFPQEGQFMVHVAVDQLPANILPGMTADVGIEIARRSDIFMVPAAAFLKGSIAVLRQGRIKKIPIEVGAADGQWLELTKGDVSETDVFVIREK